VEARNAEVTLDIVEADLRTGREADAFLTAASSSEITPLAAREPKSVAAAAPLTTSTLSMSAGLMSAMLEPSTTPSTMYSGSWPLPAALIDVGPRRIT
jgi:hypothetical protein